MYPGDEKTLTDEIRQLSAYGQLELAEQDMVLGEMLQAITDRVSQLLNGSHEKLLQLLYRVDVPEHLAREAFARSSGDELAGKLALLILQRMVQKAETRLKYRNGTL